MYAIIENGGKQFKVSKGTQVDVDLMDKEVGAEIEFSDVLLLDDGKSPQVGPVSGAKVMGKVVLDCVKDEKLISYKYKRRKNYHRKLGHRQKYTRVEITEIVGGA
ncbi:MAG: 50S ribosomal protein L21 [Chlamydiia bacterium]|nr:50S ribosomal protein L21 [Chlamydiia bacterium]